MQISNFLIYISILMAAWDGAYFYILYKNYIFLGILFKKSGSNDFFSKSWIKYETVLFVLKSNYGMIITGHINMLHLMQSKLWKFIWAYMLYSNFIHLFISFDGCPWTKHQIQINPALILALIASNLLEKNKNYTFKQQFFLL